MIYQVKIDDLFICHLGHGYSVTHKDTHDPNTNDWIRLAHINYDRSIDFYKKLPKDVCDFIIDIAKTDEGGVSVTQEYIKVLVPIKDSIEIRNKYEKTH